jgi:hypothetical protein
MLCECAGNHVAASGQQQTERRNASRFYATATNDAQYDAAESHNHSTPSGNRLQELKAWLTEKAPWWINVPVMAIALFSVCYHVSKAIVDWMTRGLTPNDQDEP